MGIYRLVLALLVAFGHMHGAFAGVYVGVVAVISFFLLSGFVMTGLVGKYYFRISAVPSFYAERLLRLAPQFLFYSVITLFFAWLGLRHDFMQSVPTERSLFYQFLIVPLNFYRKFPSMLLPQAWSLGLEAIFYSVFPFILLLRLRGWVAVLSLMIYACAYFGVLDTELWGYRYLPGTLFIFICGSFLFSEENRWEKAFVVLFWLISLILFGWSFYQSEFGSLYNRSVLLGLIVGIPFIKLLKPLSQEVVAVNTLDALAGNLSYGVFLSHMLVIGALQSFAGVDLKSLTLVQDVFVTACVFVISIFLGYVSYRLVEEPLVARRRKNRQNHLMAQTCDLATHRSSAS